MKIASLGLACLLGMLTAQPNFAQDPPDSAAYLLVIDHSGSMLERDGPGPTRWDLMVDRAATFLETVPLESRIWMAVFSAPAKDAEISETWVATEAIRRDLVDQVRNSYGDPSRSGGTALYDTLEIAFLKAEQLGEESPNRFISVMVYTDGEDSTGSKDKKRAELEERFGKLIGKNKYLYVFLTQLKEGLTPPLEGLHIEAGTPKSPVSMRLEVESPPLQLPSPSIGESTVSLDLKGNPGAVKLMEGRKARIRFVGEGFEAVLSPAVFDLALGPKEFTLTPKNRAALSKDQAYSGELVIDWPETETRAVMAPDTVPIRFQKLAPPVIAGMTPSSGAVYPAGDTVWFTVNTLAGAEVRWDFYGDGSKVGEGAKSSFVYPGADEFKVGVTVTDPATGASTSGSIEITILDLSVTIDPLPPVIFAGQEVKLNCTASEGITSFTWWVDGRDYKGKELAYRFKEGTRSVQVVGAHPRRNVSASPLTFQVLAAPRVSLLSPASGVDIMAGAPYPIKIETIGPIESISCVLRDSDTNEEIKEYVVDVERAEAGVPIITEIVHTFAEGGAQRVTVVVEGHMGNASPAGFALAKSAEVAIVPPKRSVAIVSPASGMRLEAGGEVILEVETVGPGIENVRFSAYLDGKGSAFASGKVGLDGSGRARWALPLSTDGDARIRVRAETLLAGGIAGPSTESAWDVTFPELIASLSVTGGARWNDPVKLEIEGEGLTGAHWDYGDGKEERTSVLQASHNYNAWGSFTAAVIVTGAGGKTRKLERLVEIPYTAPSASVTLESGGSSVMSAEPDDILEFNSASTGDVVTETWTLDGKALDPAKGNLIFTDEERGDHTLELVVTGPRGADGSKPAIDRSVLDFRVVRFDHGLFFTGLAALLVLLGFLGRFLLGNGGRLWKVAVACPSDGDFQLPYPLRKYWNRWTKRASLPVFKLLPQAGVEETRNHLLIFKPNATGGFATMGYSEASKGSDDRGREKTETTQRTLTWEVWDRLNPNLEDSGYAFSVRLERPTAKKSLSGDVVFFILSSMLALGAAYALYQHVYLSF